MEIRLLSFELRAADGVMLSGRGWMPPEPRVVIALVHGINEHSGRYGFIAERAALRGLGLVSMDLRGHGCSPGERAYVNEFDEYLLDVDALLAKARELAAGRPVFLMGHSMGGAIALRWVAQRGPQVAGLILSSAALRVGGDVPRLLVLLAPLLSRLLPHVRGTRLSPEVLSRIPEAVAAYEADPLVTRKGAPARTGAELLRAMGLNRAAAARLKLPVYLFHGDADRLTDPAGSCEINDLWGGADHSLRLWPGSRHETLNDLDREAVATELLDWISTRAE
jgi:alpha-beta hydrolase superfamily lysophospholipase